MALQLLEGSFESKDGVVSSLEDLKLDGKVVGLYFSAHWCPPCRQFTPMLVQKYNELVKNQDFEIIFVSADQNASAFKQYFGTMPWKALPFGDARCDALNEAFGVEGIPMLIFIDGTTGDLITMNGRSKVLQVKSAKDIKS